jgi:hypothetical protein
VNEKTATDALRMARSAWGVQDQWRHDNPRERTFTHSHTHRGNQELAHLDRIYMSRRLANYLFEWKLRLSKVPTDLWLVSVKLTPKDAPIIGQGH